MTNNQEITNSSRRPRRPAGVTLLALGVLTLAALNLVRLVQAIKQWDFLASLPGASPLYLVLTGLVWTIVGFPLAWGLWFGYGWSAQGTRIIILVYALYFWLDRIFLAHDVVTATKSSAWPFMAGTTLLLLVLSFWILASKKAKAFFGSTS